MVRCAYLALIAAIIAVAFTFGKAGATSGPLQTTALAQIVDAFLGHEPKPSVDVLRDWPGYPDEEDIPDRFRYNVADCLPSIVGGGGAFCYAEARLRPSRSRVGLSRAPPRV